MNTGKIIKNAIDHYGVTQKALAEEIGVLPQHVNQMIKRDTCNTGMLDRIAKAFKLKTSELIQLGEEE